MWLDFEEHTKMNVEYFINIFYIDDNLNHNILDTLS